MSDVAVRVLVAGRVQGVGFRWATSRAARDLGLRGWVRNLVDGRVEAFAEGDAAAVEDLVDWLAKGPRGARVDRLERLPAEPEGTAAFEIRR